MRRNLTGIVIFDKLEGDDKRKPTCLEDCNKETLDKYLNGLEKETLINLSKILCHKIKEIGEDLDLIKM